MCLNPKSSLSNSPNHQNIALKAIILHTFGVQVRIKQKEFAMFISDLPMTSVAWMVRGLSKSTYDPNYDGPSLEAL